MAVVLTNNAHSTLAAAIGAGSATITVQPADAGRFPSPSNGTWFPVVLVDAGGNIEFLRATQRVDNIITVLRAREGSNALAFAAGTTVSVRLTAAAVAEFALASETYSKDEIDTALEGKTSTSLTISTSGLAGGGGALSENRTIDVPIATLAEAQAGAADNKALTPERGTDLLKSSPHAAAMRKIRKYSANGSYAKPSWLKYVLVHVYGAGGGYNSGNGNSSDAGGTTSFGTHCSATGGAAGSDTNTNPGGGSGVGGDINLDGGRGNGKGSTDSKVFEMRGGDCAGPHGGTGEQGIGKWPGGGGGTDNSTDPRSSGAGGGCSIKLILASDLASSTAVTIGQGGDNGADGGVIIYEFGEAA